MAINYDEETLHFPVFIYPTAHTDGRLFKLSHAWKSLIPTSHATDENCSRRKLDDRERERESSCESHHLTEEGILLKAYRTEFAVVDLTRFFRGKVRMDYGYLYNRLLRRPMPSVGLSHHAHLRMQAYYHYFGLHSHYYAQVASSYSLGKQLHTCYLSCQIVGRSGNRYRILGGCPSFNSRMFSSALSPVCGKSLFRLLYNLLVVDHIRLHMLIMIRP